MEANSHLVYPRLASLLTLTLGSGGARPSAEDRPMYQHLVILVAVKALASIPTIENNARIGLSGCS
jgi:hypothetical protein